MGKISDIVPQKKKPNRSNVYVDGDFAFGISADLRFEKRLETGQLISDKQSQALIAADQVERLVNKAFKFLSYRPRSEKETRDHLLWKGRLREVKGELEKQKYGESVEQAIRKLKKLKQLDDQEFAKWWVEQRSRFNPRGQIFLKKELQSKGVGKNIIDQVLNNNIETQVQLAMKAATKKVKSCQKLDQHEFKTKLGQYLVRRGFNWEVTKKVVDTFLKKR
jgi:regulatory protein